MTSSAPHIRTASHLNLLCTPAMRVHADNKTFADAGVRRPASYGAAACGAGAQPGHHDRRAHRQRHGRRPRALPPGRHVRLPQQGIHNHTTTGSCLLSFKNLRRRRRAPYSPGAIEMLEWLSSASIRPLPPCQHPSSLSPSPCTIIRSRVRSYASRRWWTSTSRAALAQARTDLIIDQWSRAMARGRPMGRAYSELRAAGTARSLTISRE